jgi:peptidoglycan hydrolase-like protein with peptidoglycan-binding domain
MKNSKQIIFLVFNIWLLNNLPSLSQPSVTPIINRPTLQVGSQGNVVSELQAVLKLLGYYQGKVDGNYSEEVKLAVARFQQAAGLTSTGITNNITWETLLPLQTATNNSSTVNNSTSTKPNSNQNQPQVTTNDTTKKPPENNNNTTKKPSENTNKKPQLLAANMPILREGMKGEPVKILQQKLKALGLFQGPIDGIFGVQTLQAVIAAQGKFKLGADGIVGQQTWRALLGQ